MIDIATERLLNLEEAAQLLPSARAGRPVHSATVFRLIQSRKLEGLRIGARWVTSVEAMQRMAERQTRAALGDETPAEAPTARMTARRRHEFARAEREAESIGF
jgi:hypothetical protein